MQILRNGLWLEARQLSSTSQARGMSENKMGIDAKPVFGVLFGRRELVFRISSKLKPAIMLLSM